MSPLAIFFPTLSFSLLFCLSPIQTKAQNHYYLIVGSYHSLEKATLQQDQWEKLGYEPKIFPPTPPSRLYRLSLFDEDSRWIVQDFQQRLPASASSWILQLPQPISVLPQSRGDRRELAFHLVYGNFQDYQKAKQWVIILRENNYPEARVIGPLNHGKETYYQVSISNSYNKLEMQRLAINHFPRTKTRIIRY